MGMRATVYVAIASGSLSMILACGQATPVAPSTGTAPVNVTPPPPSSNTFVVTGTVREVPPTSHPIAGAIVRVTGGPDMGAQAGSDANGTYSIAGLSAGFVIIETTAPGYSLYAIGTDLAGNKNVDLWLAPTAPQNSTGATATARCNDGAWSWAQTGADACTNDGGVAYPVCPGVLCPNPARTTRQ